MGIFSSVGNSPKIKNKPNQSREIPKINNIMPPEIVTNLFPVVLFLGALKDSTAQSMQARPKDCMAISAINKIIIL
jgi:hypothetical protein